MRLVMVRTKVRLLLIAVPDGSDSQSGEPDRARQCPERPAQQ